MPAASLLSRFAPVVLFLAAFGGGSLAAQPLFEIEAETAVDSFRGGDSSLPDLIEDFLLARGDFAGLETAPEYGARLSYAGVPGAVELDVNEAGTEVTLTIPSTGFSRTFTGTGRAEVQREIEAFIQDEGAREWGRFNREMAGRSLVAVTDGNPNSTTARTAAATFREFGRRPGRTSGESLHGGTVRGRFGFSFFPGYSRFEAGDFKGEAYSVHLAGRFRFNERFGAALLVPASYLKVEDAAVYRAGLTAGVPITLIPDRPRRPLHWQISPSAGLTGAGSVDFAAGGLVEHYTATSLLAYNLQRVTLSMGNQYGIYRGRNVTYDDYEFHTDLNQQILKTGLALSIPLGPKWVLDLYGEDTRFRKEAAVDRYKGVGADLVYRFGGRGARPGRGYLKAGIVHEFADDYSSLAGQAGLGLRF